MSSAPLFAVDEIGDVLAVVKVSAEPRWLLCGSAETLVGLVEKIMDGTAPVFGLAGVVVPGDGPYTGRARRGGSEPRTAAVEELVALGVPVLAGSDVDRFWAEDVGRGPQVPADYAALLASDRVTSRVRAVNARRALADDPAYVPVALDGLQLEVLRALAAVVVPQDGEPLDLAARVDAQLAAGEGDGWRFADLPADVEAYRASLTELGRLGVTEAVVEDVTAGDHGPELAHWLEDAVVDLLRQWLAHPANLARTGFDGLATGGDDGLVGFVELGIGAREPWEPRMQGTTA